MYNSHLLASGFWDDFEKFASENLVSFLSSLLIAWIVYFVGKNIAMKWILSLLSTSLNKTKLDDTLKNFTLTLAKVFLYIILFGIILSSVSIDLDLAAIVAASVLAIGFALQGTLSNFASGVLLILFRPINVNDFVEVAGTTGTVEEISLFTTVLKSPDNVQIIVSNSSVIGNKICNFSAKPIRRVDLVFGCAYSDDIKAVKELLEDSIKSHSAVLSDPAPVVAVNELGDSSVNFVVRPWVKAEDYWTTKWDLTEQIKLKFDEKGFNIPFPTQTIELKKD